MGGESRDMTKVVGTIRWAAPEVHLGEGYDERMDVYSFGVVLWEMLSGKLPFIDEQFDTQVEERVIAGVRPDIPECCGERLRELIECCWSGEKEQRPPFSSIVTTLV